MRGCVCLCGGSCNSLSTPIPPGMHSRAHQRGQLNKFVGLATLGALRTLWERGYRGQRIAGTFSIASILPTTHQANGSPCNGSPSNGHSVAVNGYPMPNAKCQMPNTASNLIRQQQSWGSGEIFLSVKGNFGRKLYFCLPPAEILQPRGNNENKYF